MFIDCTQTPVYVISWLGYYLRNNITLDQVVSKRRIRSLYYSKPSFEYFENSCSHYIGIYCGEIESIYNDKILHDLFSIRKILINPYCTFSRKLLRNSDIKKVNNISNADTIIIPDITLRKTNYDSSTYLNNTLIFKDLIQGSYYVINSYPDNAHLTPTLKGEINQILNKETIDSSSDYIKILKALGILIGTELIYEGPIVIAQSPIEFNLLKDIKTVYPKIIFESSFAKLLQEKLPALTNQNFINIKNLFKSRIPSNIELGLRLLITFNITNYTGRIGILLNEMKDILITMKYFNSTEVSQLLKFIGITRRDIIKSIDQILPTLYRHSFNIEDQTFCKEFYKKYQLSKLNKRVESIDFLNQAFKLKLNITFEDA